MDDILDRLQKQQMEIGNIHRSQIHRLSVEHGLHRGQPAILFLVGENPGCSQNDLAEKLFVSPASIAVSLRRMEIAGLISRKVPEDDRRRHQLILTPKGEKITKLCAMGTHKLDKAMFYGLTEEELRQLYSIMEKIAENLKNMLSQGGSIID